MAEREFSLNSWLRGVRLCKRGIACVALLLAGLLPGAVAATDNAAFREEFDRFDRKAWYVSDGWSNGDHQNCQWSKRAIGVSEGNLSLRYIPLPNAKAGKPAALCGEIQTKARYGYGTYEARIRTDAGSGLNAAFFTYIGPVHKQPHDEIDVEILPRSADRVWLNKYQDGTDHGMGQLADLPGFDSGAYHTYAFIWEPGRIRWFIDGRQMMEQTENLPSHRQKIYFSFWGTDTLVRWMGPFTMPDQPLTMNVDWVAFTPLGQGCAFEGSVLCTLE